MHSFWSGDFSGVQVPVRNIEPDSKQVRTEIKRESVVDLAESIRKAGIVVPLLGFRVGDKVRLIAGHRRLAAAKLVGLKEVPVVLRESGGDAALVGQVLENVGREDMNVADTCHALKRLQKQMGCSQAVLAKIVGKSESWVSQTLAYDSFAKDVAALVDDGLIGPAVARHLNQITNAAARTAAIRDAREHGLTESAAISWKRNAEAADEQSAGSRPSPGVPEDVDPKRHWGLCGACGKRHAWAEMHTLQICSSCMSPKARAEAGGD